MITIVILIWVATGLFFATTYLHILCEGNPRIMDILITESLREIEESGTKVRLTHGDVEFIIKIWVAIIYVIGWPILIINNKL